MDIETQKIIELLFPSGIQESWKENPDFYQYLSKIGGYNVDSLMNEPDHLSDEKITIQQRIQDLVFSNYKTFIHAAKTSREISKEFRQTEVELDYLLNNIPKFIKKCESFCEKSKSSSIHKKLNSLTLCKNTELTEILELPDLMDLCLEHNLYSEALELSQYARYLGSKHGEILIIEDIVYKIEGCWSSMVNKVVDSLKDDLPLPKCLQLMGLLRSIDAFTESELRIKFILARDSWFKALLESIPVENPTVHLTKTIELSRIHLFNIITQYKAIFNDDDHSLLGQNTTINDSDIFYQWMDEKVLQFLETLEQDLPSVTSIDSILGQCTYFGISFGRVGADFTGRMSDVFIKVIIDKFDSHVSQATKLFEINIQNFELVKQPQNLNSKIGSVIQSENPPEHLIEYYPLAEYCNCLIVAFNELRLNPPVSLVQIFTGSIQNSLLQVAKVMSTFYRKLQKSKNFTPVDRDNMVRFTECFSEQLVPYIQHCISTLFPLNQVAAHLGISVSQLQKEEISYLNLKQIFQPVNTLLPMKNVNMDLFLPNTTTSEKSIESILPNIESAQNLMKEAVADVPERDCRIIEERNNTTSIENKENILQDISVLDKEKT